VWIMCWTRSTALGSIDRFLLFFKFFQILVFCFFCFFFLVVYPRDTELKFDLCGMTAFTRLFLNGVVWTVFPSHVEHINRDTNKLALLMFCRNTAHTSSDELRPRE